MRSSVHSALDWLRSLFWNAYFWMGTGVLVALGVAAFFLVDAVIMPSYTRHDVSIRVPNVENRSFDEAKQLIQERDLRVERQVGRFNPNVERDVVVDQTPLPNADVKPGRRVYLTVNAGEAPMVKLPDLNGMSVREAKNRISSLGLEVGSAQPDTIPSPYANTVTRQRPAPGDSLRQGNTVNIWYSTGLGNETVDVPDVVGQTVAEAESFLLQHKLRAVVVDPTSSEDASDETTEEPASPTDQYVREQGRSPGTSVRTGTEIRLFTTDDPSEIPDPDSTSDSEDETNLF